MKRRPLATSLLIMLISAAVNLTTARAATIYSSTLDPDIPFGNAATGWATYQSGSGGAGVFAATTNASFRTLRYLFAQHATSITTAENYLLYSNYQSSINTASYTNLYVDWLQQGDSLSGFSNSLAVQVNGIWYAASNASTLTSGEVSLNLLDSALIWTAINTSTVTLDTGNTITLADKTITGVGFFVNNLPGSNGTNAVTLRLDNLRITDALSTDNNWLGLSGKGGDGFWDNGGSTGYGNWDANTGYKWGPSSADANKARQATFGGVNDDGVGGIVTVIENIGMNAPSDGYVFKFLDKANGYIIQGDNTARTITINEVGNDNIFIDPAATVTFRNNLTITRAAAINLYGGGKLVVDNGATLQNTAGIASIVGGSTIQVNSGGQFLIADTLVVGSTVLANVSGTANLIVNGGIVTTGTSTGGNRNFILGNRTQTVGDVTVTITSGAINVAGNASNGLVFENTGDSSAWFNLNGGVVTTRRVLRQGTPSTGKESHFNFNGGVLRVDAVGGATSGVADNTNNSFAFLVASPNLSYRVKEGGAIIDTNGRNVLIDAPLITAATNDGGFTKRGAGILQLHGINTFNGGTKIQAGTLSISSNANLGASSGGIQIYDNATLRTTASIDLSARAIAIGNPNGGGTATIEVTGNNTLDYINAITDNDAANAGSLNKTGSGTLALADVNTYSGKTTVSAGTLKLAEGLVGTGSIDNSPWIEVHQNAVFDASDSSFYQFTAPTVSGNGTFIGTFIAGSGIHLKPGLASSGQQGLTNVNHAGNLTGLLTFDGDLTLEGVADETRITFQLGGNARGTGYDAIDILGGFTADGDTLIQVLWANGWEASHGDSFQLFSWDNLISWGGFDANANGLADLALPTFTNELLKWDTDDFLSDGIIRVVPEPSRALLVALALGSFLLRRRRFGVRRLDDAALDRAA